MEKLAKKLSIFVFLFASMQMWGSPLSLLSISPHTHDMYASPPTYPAFSGGKIALQDITCEKVIALADSPSIRQSTSQNEKGFMESLKDADEKIYFLHTLIFLYSISAILIFFRVTKLFSASKS
jgi:hypothetical protein